jgi:hypothetical protein
MNAVEFMSVYFEGHFKWLLCHQDTAFPQVADEGGGLQTWRAALNILNKQSWTADKGWSSGLDVGWEAGNSSA